MQWTYDVQYMANDITAPARAYILAPGLQVPVAPDGSNSTAQPWTFYNIESVMNATRAEFDVTDNTTHWATGGFVKYKASSSGRTHLIPTFGRISRVVRPISH